MQTHLTYGQLQALLVLQKETNVAYMGENWRDVWSEHSVKQSIHREYAEFLDETERDWHCYKPNPVFNRTDAVYELVDIIHFMLTLLIIRGVKVCEHPEAEAFIMSRDNVGSHEMVGRWFDHMMKLPTIHHFALFLNNACAYLDINIETYMAAHRRKNDRNRVRAAAGVVTGGYDKSLETPLTLEF